jgi:aminoglycoside phosphotransferase (APT) family kinase protein
LPNRTCKCDKDELVREAPSIDGDALGQWLDEALGSSETLDVHPMQGGGSCEVFDLRRGGEHWVLRRSPAVASAATAHDVLREYRILDAIRNEGVRIPEPIVACADPSVAGTPFYVMQHVDGMPIRGSLPPAYAEAPDQQGQIGGELIDALVEIHNVDWQRCGLSDLGKPEGYLQRQVSRWLSQLASYQVRELPAVAQVANWLEGNRPPDQSPTLVHGDYKLDNVLFSLDLPPRILAVVDWEMATLGDPLVDLGWALIFWPAEGNTLSLGSPGQAGGFRLECLPCRGELVDRYAGRTGRDVSHLDWYEAFAAWKLAIVLEGNYAKYLRGESRNPMHPVFEKVVELLLERALETIEKTKSGHG